MIQVVLELLLSVVFWAILFPVVLAVATPFILLHALWMPGSYTESMKADYRAVINFWTGWGIVIVP